MAKRDSSVSCESLELLLDTMCNTFGGVMFIAIALIVVSSVMPKIVMEIDEESIDKEAVDAIKSDITECQVKLNILNKNRNLKESVLERYKNHPNRKLIEDLANLKETYAKKTVDLKIADTDLQTSRIEAKELIIDKTKLQESKAIIEDKIKIIEQEIADEKKNNESLQKELKDKLALVESRKLTFPKLKEVKTRPFAILLRDNKLYRISDYKNDLLVNEVLYTSPDVKCKYVKEFNYALISPIIESGISPDNIQNLKSVFGRVNKSEYFIWCMVKKDSFKSLFVLKDYFLKNGYKINWSPKVDDTDFIIGFTDKVTYTAQ
jgi:hypothetical protein